jgi:hypothetical protein
MIFEGDTVKDGHNLQGVYVRRRERPDGINYHTFEIDEELLREISKHPVTTSLKKSRKEWTFNIGDESFGITRR